MHEFVSLNGNILDPADGRISAVSSATLYGKGIFTTIAIYDGKPFLWEKHWRRLRGNAAKLRIDLMDVSEETTRHALDRIIEANGVRDGRARITIFDESPSRIWPFEGANTSSLLMTTAEARPQNGSFTLGISKHPVYSSSPFSRVKSCNYLENLLAFEDAVSHGVNEEVRLNERGEIASACLANIFWTKNSLLFTPSLKTGCLPGITREFVLKSLKCSEVEAELGALYIADSIFLTSAGLGITEVRSFQGLEFRPSSHEIMNLLPKTG